MAVQKNIVFKIDIEGTGKAEDSLKGLESRIDKLKELRQGEQIGSKAFNDLSRDIQKAEAAIKDVELQFEALDFEQKLTAGSDAIVGIAGGFAAAEGAMALFGAESEQIEKTLSKVAGALALTSGLRDLANGVIAFRKFAVAQKVAAVATRIFNAALAANPIGIIIVAILAAIAAVKALIQAFSGTAEVAQRSAEEIVASQDKVIASYDRQIARLKQIQSLVSSGFNRDKKAIDLQIKQLQLVKGSEEQIIALKKQKIDITVKEQASLQKALYDENIAINLQIFNIRRASRELKKQGAATRDERRENAAKIEELQRTMESNQQKRLDTQQVIESAATQKKILDIELINKKEVELDAKRKKRREERKANESRRLQSEEAELNEFLTAQEQAQTEYQDSFKTAQDIEVQLIKDKFFNLIELAKKYGEDVAALEKARDKAIADATKKAEDESMDDQVSAFNDFLLSKEQLENEYLDSKLSLQDQEINAARDKYNELIELAKKYGDDTTVLEEARSKAIADIELKYKIDNINKGLDAATTAADGLSSLNDLVLANQIKGLKEGDARRTELERKAFERSKKIQIAQALISAAQGVVSILSTPSTIPDPFGTVFKVVQIASLAATTAAQISKIKSAQFGGGASGSIGSAGGGGASAGAGGVPINNISNTASLIDQEQQNVTQVVVVETDITNTQNTVAAVTESATF
jgi:hypothetical protein